MKAILTLAASLFAATPALAADNTNFVGPRAELQIGLADLTKVGTSRVTNGAAAGFDLPLGSNVTLGAEGNVSNVFGGKFGYGGSARLGLAVSEHVAFFGTAGYAKVGSLSGPRFGGGIEIASDKNLYLKAEYRYSDFRDGIKRHEGLLGLGLRF